MADPLNLPPADAPAAPPEAPAAPPEAPVAPPAGGLSQFAPDMQPTSPATGAPTTHANLPGRAALKTNCLSRIPVGLLLALVVLVTLVVVLVVAQLCGRPREGFTSLCGGKGRLPLSQSERDHYSPHLRAKWEDPDLWYAKLAGARTPLNPTIAGTTAAGSPGS